MDRKELADILSNVGLNENGGTLAAYGGIGNASAASAESIGIDRDKINGAFKVHCGINFSEGTEEEITEVIYDIKEIIGKIKKALPPLPRTELAAVPRKTDIYDSKLGGAPYMPKDFEYPKGRSGPYENKPLIFLGQLNFERLPRIEDFPEKGILQFYISDDGGDDTYYGMNCGDLTAQDGFRVIYHENIITDREKLAAPYKPSEENAPLFYGNSEYLLEAREVTLSEADNNIFSFYELLIKYCSEKCGEDLISLRDIERAGFGNVDFLNYLGDNEKLCIGGYPSFTEDDPRFDSDYADCDALLFQIPNRVSAEKNLPFKNAGTLHFLIPRRNLRQKNFSRILYTMRN